MHLAASDAYLAPRRLSVAGRWASRLAVGPKGEARARWLLAFGLFGFAAHVAILSFRHSLASAPLLSNIVQAGLGVLAILAMVAAGRRSSRFGRHAWFLAALAFSIYTVGQVIYIYGHEISQPECCALVYDPIFFFWIVPLVAAGVGDPAEIAEGFEWSSILDVSILVLLALALHLSMFVDSRWQWHADEMLLWRFKIRLVRDLIVLACLWGRFSFSRYPQVRALFLRLGVFYSAYALCNIVYFFGTEAAHGVRPGIWIDFVWSIPRVLIIGLAATWDWREEIATGNSVATRWHRYLLGRAPIVVPLLVIAVSVHLFSSARLLWGGLIFATLAVVSLRLRLTQSRQEHAVARLVNSTNLLHSVIEGTSEAVFLKDAQGRYLLINGAGARFLSRTPEEIVGKTDYDIFSAPDADALVKNDQKVMRTGKAVTAEEVLTTIGPERTFLSTKNPYRDPQDRIIGVLGITVETTEHRRMEKRLQKSQRMESIGTFSSGMAHDFNNLLTVIKGYSYLVQADAEGNQKVRDGLDQINKAASRATSLIDQLLAFSRQQILEPRVINLNEIVAHIRKMLDRLIGEDVRIETHFASDLGNVKADPGQVEQVVMNLAANARDAMPSGGVLSVTTANFNFNSDHCSPDPDLPPGAYVCLTVSDTGIGMDARTQSHIFEPFFTTKPQGKGTGLGLATVYGIVRQSGGYVGVESEPGAGARFRIYLPRVYEVAEKVTQATARAAPAGGHQTILVVDDDPQLRRLAKDVLTRSGFTVLVAESGEQAGEIAAGHDGSIHLLLTDVILPGAGGPRTAQEVCANTNSKNMRVLYMSGYPNDALARHGVLDEETFLLRKPFSPTRLVEKVREVLQNPSSNAFSKTA